MASAFSRASVCEFRPGTCFYCDPRPLPGPVALDRFLALSLRSGCTSYSGCTRSSLSLNPSQIGLWCPGRAAVMSNPLLLSLHFSARGVFLRALVALSQMALGVDSVQVTMRRRGVSVGHLVGRRATGLLAHLYWTGQGPKIDHQTSTRDVRLRHNCPSDCSGSMVFRDVMQKSGLRERSPANRRTINGIKPDGFRQFQACDRALLDVPPANHASAWRQRQIAGRATSKPAHH